MAIINSSASLYGASASPFADASFAVGLKLDGDFEPEVFNPYVDAEWNSEITLEGDLEPTSYRLGDETFQTKVQLAGDWACDTAIILQHPPPITKTVSPNAFSNQRYAAARLYINNVPTPFVSAEISAPGKTLGKSLSIELARADLAQLPDGASFKFQIGKIVSGSPVWHTILDGGKLGGRSFSMNVGRDSLKFTAKAADAKLDKYPKNNLIVYDASRGEISLEETEALPTSTNEFIFTETRGVSVLTLYKLLEIAFVEGCSFASVETDIPNFEIARCDFSVTNSYAAAVAQFIGMYEPEFAAGADGALSIQKTINPLPPSFTPNPLYASRYPNFSESLENSSPALDGYILQYTALAGTRFVDRSLPTLVEGSAFGGIETTSRRKVREWFEDGSATAVRSEPKSETIETRRGGSLTGRETLVNSFDRLGRSTGYTKTIEARLPDVDLPVGNGGSVAMSLLKTREEQQKIYYKTNPFAPRSTVLSRIETNTRALLALDADNTALDASGNDAPYASDYQRVFEAGNLKTTMTKLFREMRNTVEHFRPLANGQVAVRYEGYDLLRNAPVPPVTDTRSGDISVANFTKQKTKTIFRAGVTQATRTGELRTLNVGELPLIFAEPLAEWLLQNPRATGNIEVTGYDESIERGVFFALKGRAGENLGNFKTLGYTVKITANSIMTTLDALKV